MKEVAPAPLVTLTLAEGLVPMEVLLPMRLLPYQQGRTLLIQQPTVALPGPIAAWLVGRFPGQVAVVEPADTATRDTDRPVAAPPAAPKPTRLKKKPGQGTP